MKGEGHPSLDQLRAFDLGQLHALERLEVEGHVAHCDTCCRRLEALPSDGLVALLRVSAGTPKPDTHDPGAASVHTPSERGTALSR